jgi:SAM-dependent methyltransferase
VVGLDINQRLAFRLKEQNTIVGTVLDLPIKSQSINTVFLGEVVEHFFDITPLIAEVSRVLKPKGKLYLTTPNVFMLFRWLQCWFLKDRKKIAASKNVRDFLSDRNHKVFWEPLSLVNILRQQSLKTIDITTKVIAIPYLSFWQDLDLPIWPFDRLGGSLCLIAEKQ